MLRLKNKNLQLSNETFDFDLNRSNFAIYRGSTAIIKAIQNGLYPFYYEIRNEVNVDPLYDLNKFKKTITSPADLKLTLKDKHVLRLNQEKLIEGINSYFTPLNYDQLKKIKN